MATHDYSISNQSFPATRSDLNNALTAIKSSNSAATAPTTSLVAGQLFYDTSTSRLKVYDGASFGAVGIDTASAVSLTDSTVSSSTTTGALKVTGGISTQNNLNVEGYTAITASTSASSTTTGALKVTGGISTQENLYVGGTLTESSARRLKTAITPITSQLEAVMKLNPVSYVKIATGVSEVGFIAEEVQEVYPTMVSKGGEGVHYSRLTAVLTSALQELKSVVDAQAREIEELKRA
jgi:hypothetical protein